MTPDEQAALCAEHADQIDMQDFNNNSTILASTDTLNAELKMPESVISATHADSVCGSITMELQKPQWDKIVSRLKLESDESFTRKMKAEELSKKINDYLAKKCEQYCYQNHISALEWITHSSGKKEKNIFEIYFKDILVCGAKVICEIPFEHQGAKCLSITDANIYLELY